MRSLCTSRWSLADPKRLRGRDLRLICDIRVGDDNRPEQGYSVQADTIDGECLRAFTSKQSAKNRKRFPVLSRSHPEHSHLYAMIKALAGTITSRRPSDLFSNSPYLFLDKVT